LFNDGTSDRLSHARRYAHADHVFSDPVGLGVVVVRKAAEAFPFAEGELSALCPVPKHCDNALIHTQCRPDSLDHRIPFVNLLDQIPDPLR